MNRSTPCPGCGLSLPETDHPPGLRVHASPACWLLYGEVALYEAEHVAQLGRLHQLMVDAYGAQHADGSASIGPAFALIGLCLAFEHDMSGTEVRAAHGYLANRFRNWPAFAPPIEPAPITVFDVAMAGSPDEHATMIERWARAVWESWTPAHHAVGALVEERLPADARSAMRGAS
jgi:hypothetical protein